MPLQLGTFFSLTLDAMTSTYAIGDLQGCHDEMTALMQRIDESCADPKLIFVGDIVNRGPRSLATLREIRALGDRAQIVLGNHDLHLLALSQGIRKLHKSDTLDEILQASDGLDLLDWMRHQPLALFEQGHLLVHAGVVPQWSAAQTMALAHEVEVVLRSDGWIDFVRDMYGNQPARWDDALKGNDRLRCIVNVLTRIRFCSADGTMNFASNEGAVNAPDGCMPWFDVPDRKTQDVTVVFGHWSTLGLMLRPNVIGLDTGCVWGGKLTAVGLAKRDVIQVACGQHRVPG